MRGNYKKGFSFIGMLMALAIVAILTGMYMSLQMGQQGGTLKQGISSIEKSKIVACNANKNVIIGHINAWRITHPNERVTLEKMRNTGVSIPTCPAGGTYSIDKQGYIICSIHDAPPPEEKTENQSQ